MTCWPPTGPTGYSGPGDHFAPDAQQHLAELAAQLASGSYQPGKLTPVPLPRPDGKNRLLHVPSVRDRMVERSILAVLTPVIDPWLGPFSYAYRPGLGTADAVQAIALLRDEGLPWVARADFHDCFGSIPVPLLRRMLAVVVEEWGCSAWSGPRTAPRRRGAARPWSTGWRRAHHFRRCGPTSSWPASTPR